MNDYTYDIAYNISEVTSAVAKARPAEVVVPAQEWWVLVADRRSGELVRTCTPVVAWVDRVPMVVDPLGGRLVAAPRQLDGPSGEPLVRVVVAQHLQLEDEPVVWLDTDRAMWLVDTGAGG